MNKYFGICIQLFTVIGALAATASYAAPTPLTAAILLDADGLPYGVVRNVSSAPLTQVTVRSGWDAPNVQGVGLNPGEQLEVALSGLAQGQITGCSGPEDSWGCSQVSVTYLSSITGQGDAPREASLVVQGPANQVERVRYALTSARVTAHTCSNLKATASPDEYAHFCGPEGFKKRVLRYVSQLESAPR